jgi:4-hydroxy-tetrahydrodipicolinate reductase
MAGSKPPIWTWAFLISEPDLRPSDPRHPTEERTVPKRYRVVAYSTGNVGVHAIAGIDARPDLELVGVWVSNPDKVGRDAGALAGLGRSLGVTATNDIDALIALRPDVVVHTAMADNRLGEALDDIAGLLRAGVNVVSSGPVFLQYPYGVVDEGMIAPVVQAAREGGVSLFVNGVDPGFGNDVLPLALTGVSERIDELRVAEILNYNTYNQAMVLFGIMGFGRPLDEIPMILQPGVLTMAWGSVVRQLAAALHFEVRGIRHGRAVIVLEHVTRLHDDLAPEWPQPAGHGCYRVQVTGEPNYTLDLQLLGSDGDHNTAGLKATAMRLVNAIPAVVEGPPGLLSALDLPQIFGRGLVASAAPPPPA